jgi:hypothetical protein
LKKNLDYYDNSLCKNDNDNNDIHNDDNSEYSMDIIDIDEGILSIISAYSKYIVLPPLASALQWYLTQLLPSER